LDERNGFSARREQSRKRPKIRIGDCANASVRHAERRFDPTTPAVGLLGHSEWAKILAQVWDGLELNLSCPHAVIVG